MTVAVAASPLIRTPAYVVTIPTLLFTDRVNINHASQIIDLDEIIALLRAHFKIIAPLFSQNYP